MNFKEISKDCPKVYNLLAEWFEMVVRAKTKDSSILTELFFKRLEVAQMATRTLFDFFDEQGIYIIIEPEIQYTREIDEDGNNPHYVIDRWGYDIHDEAYQVATGYQFDTRTDAEEAAFTKAFYVLERKINRKPV